MGALLARHGVTFFVMTIIIELARSLACVFALLLSLLARSLVGLRAGCPLLDDCDGFDAGSLQVGAGSLNFVVLL